MFAAWFRQRPKLITWIRNPMCKKRIEIVWMCTVWSRRNYSKRENFNSTSSLLKRTKGKWSSCRFQLKCWKVRKSIWLTKVNSLPTAWSAKRRVTILVQGKMARNCENVQLSAGWPETVAPARRGARGRNIKISPIGGNPSSKRKWSWRKMWRRNTKPCKIRS